MKYEKLLMITMPILLVVAIVLGYFKVIRTQNDSIKFKNEYENLNSNKNYYKINIDKENPIKYSSYKEIFEVLKSKTGIIYLGYPEDNNSRFAIETLLKVIEENNVDTTVYYLDIHNDRDSYTIENNELVYDIDKNGNQIKGTENYFKLLKLLDKNLSEYILYLDDKEYDVEEKRIIFPSIIFVNKGEVLGIEYASTDMEFEDLYYAYEHYILDMYSSVCDTNKETPC